MPTQVDPAAFQNAFYANQDWLARGRQEQAQTAQNRLAQMYAANNDARAASAEQRAQAGFDAGLKQQQERSITATQAANREWAQNAYNFAKRAPAQIPNVIRSAKQRGMLPAEFNENITPEELDGFAVQWGLVAPEQESVAKMGAYSPGDYTPQSWAQFLRSNDPAVLERYTTPRQDFAPSYQNVTRTLADGSTEQGTFDTRSGQYNWSGAVIPAGTKKRVEAQASAEGEAAGSQSAKAPAQASMAYVIGEFRKQLPKTTQGGVFGVVGRAGSIFDYKDATRFDNLREQLSTEMRTVFRIPGEGTLSDREQAQYGIQLPSRNNSPDVNRDILNDIEQRVALRLQSQIPNSQPSSQSAPVRVSTPAEAAKLPTGTRFITPDGQERVKR
jgi:hypothetical protein